MKSRYRIVSPIRFFTFILIVTIFLTLLIYGIATNGSTEAATTDTYMQVTVTDGDTVWNVAEEHCGKNADVRSLVDEICAINDVKAGDVQAGDTLFVPVE